MSGVGPPRPAASLRHAFNQSQGMVAVPAATAAELQLRLSCQAGHAGVTGAPRMPCRSVVPVGRGANLSCPSCSLGIPAWQPTPCCTALLRQLAPSADLRPCPVSAPAVAA